MIQRMNIDQAEPGIYKVMNAAEKTISTFKLNKGLMELLKLRASQINGCGYCVDLHSADAVKAGETVKRVFALSAWWETPFFTDAERAALQLTEEITRIWDGGIKDETFANVKAHFSETEIAQIIFIANTTNSWNRIAISMHMVAE